MVCDKCQTKLSKIVGVDPYRNKAHNKLPGAKKPVVGPSNKLVGVEKKASVTAMKCRICKCATHQPTAYYCNTCAFQKGICAMCGKKVVDVKNSRQSIV